jgi:hypothetical protein
MVNVKDTAFFIQAARDRHGDKYDYSQTVYAGSQKPITIICRKCGNQTTLPEAKLHLKKEYPHGCRHRCYRPRNCGGQVFDTESFIEASRETHGDKYSYGNSAYIAANKPITITCKNCGPVTIAYAGSHYRKRKACGCRRCERMEGEVSRRGSVPVCVFCGEWLRGYVHAMCVCNACERPDDQRFIACFCKGLSAEIRRGRISEWQSWASNKYRQIKVRPNLPVRGGQIVKSFVSFEEKMEWERKSRLRREEDDWSRKARKWSSNLKLRVDRNS